MSTKRHIGLPGPLARAVPATSREPRDDEAERTRSRP